MDERKRFGDLDLLRLLAIVLVVAHHGMESSFTPPTGSPSFIAVQMIGVLGVGVFFFISGYLLKRRYPSIGTVQETSQFFNRRFWRIFPLYWLALMISLVLGQMASEVGTAISAGNLLVHLLGLQMVLSPTYIPGRAFWFIGAIVVCYLWYPLLVYRTPSVVGLFLRAVTALVLMRIVWVFIGLPGGGVLEYFPIFILGVAAGTSDFLRCDGYRFWRSILAVAAIPMLVYAYLTYSDYSVVRALSLSLPLVRSVEEIGAPLLATFCFILLLREAYMTIAPKSPRLLHLIAAGATASYAVYLFHKSLFTVLGSLVGGPPAAVFTVYVASVPVLFFACYYLQLAVDRLIYPLRDWRPAGLARQ